MTSTWVQEPNDDGTFSGVIEPIITVEDLKVWLNYPEPDEFSSDDDLLTNMVTAACDYIEREIGPIAPTLYTERYDGWGGTEVVLIHSPVISITYVNEYWSTGGLHVLTESTPANDIDGYQIQHHTGRLIRVFQGNWPRTWFPGSRNVEVSYVAGHSPVPGTLQMAACELAAHWWQQGHQARAKGYGSPQNSQYEATAPAGEWIGVPNKVIDKLNMFRVPVLG